MEQEPRIMTQLMLTPEIRQILDEAGEGAMVDGVRRLARDWVLRGKPQLPRPAYQPERGGWPDADEVEVEQEPAS